MGVDIGYRQIHLEEQDRDETAFVCQAGLYRNTRMPFCSANTPATLRRALDAILSVSKLRTCLVYLDAMIALSNLVNEQLQHVVEVIHILQSAQVWLEL